MTEILRTWQAHGLTCKLWQEPAGSYRGCVFIAGQPVVCAETPASAGQSEAESAVETLAAARARRRRIWLIKDTTPFVDIAMHLEPPKGVPNAECIREPFAITADVEVIPCSWEVFHAITSACDPPGANRGRDADLRAPLYLFARTNAPRSPHSEWDSDEKLQLCIALSRVVRPTSLGFEYAARLVGDLHSGEFELIPGPVRGFGAHAWISEPERDWLSPSDLTRLREVASKFFDDPLPQPSRLWQAFWFFEYTAQTERLHIRWLFVATAVESLLCTDTSQSTRHFTRRLPAMAQMVSPAPFSKDDASRMWGIRSAISHGSKRGGLGEEDLAVYRRVEEILRATLERAILDKTFRAIFASIESINAAFPVDPPLKRDAKCPSCGTTVVFAP